MEAGERLRSLDREVVKRDLTQLPTKPAAITEQVSATRRSKMANLQVVAVVVLCLLHTATSLSIREIINQRVELQTLNQYMTNIELLTELGYSTGQHKYTCFLPHNDAFKIIPQNIVQKYVSSSRTVREEFDNIMKYHCVLSLDGSGVIFSNTIDDDIFESMADGAPNMYLKRIGTGHFMNGARIVDADIQASNGVIHIIDHIHYDIGQTINVYEFLDHHRQTSEGPSTRSFFELLDIYQNFMSTRDPGKLDATKYMNHDARMTIFIPTNEAISKIPTQTLGRLKNDPDTLQKVIESHILLNTVQHSNILAQSLNQEINAMAGKIVPKAFGANLYVSNDCAQGRLTSANITVANGVIHMVDGLLGYVYNDAHEEVEQDDMLGRFYGHLRSASPEVESMLQLPPGVTGDIPPNRQVTVFAPIDSAFIDSEVDLTQNAEELNSVLKMHIIEGRMMLSDMFDGKEKETKMRDIDAKFTIDGEDRYVEVEHVKARIVDGDICVKNGIVHKIDRVLGFTSSTIMDVIDRDPDLAAFYKAIRSAGMSGYLSDPTKKITMFAPTEAAFEAMRTGNLGRKLLDSDYSGNLVNVLNRHILTREFFTDELNLDQVRTLETVFDDITIVKRGPKDFYLLFGDAQIQLVRYDMRCANGVIHFIDSVMYSEGDPNASEWVGAASTCHLSTVLLLALQALVVMLRRL